MKYWLIVLFTIICVLLIVFRRKQFFKQHELLINFTLTTVATLLGVIIAVGLSEQKEIQKEKDDLVKVLNSGIAVTEQYERISRAFISEVDNVAFIKVLGNGYSDSIPNKKQNLPKLEFLNHLLSDNGITKLISEKTLTSLHLSKLNMDNTRSNSFEIYVVYVKNVLTSLELEKQYQLNEISKETLIEKYNDAENELMKEIMKVSASIEKKIKSKENLN